MSGLPIPSGFEDLDSDWFGSLFETNVLDVSDGGATGGAAVTSRVARLRLRSDPAESAPAAVVAKIANPQWKHGRFLYAREVSFYRDLYPAFAADPRLPVPVCFHANMDPESGAFVLILEDVSRAQPGHRLNGLTVLEAEAVTRTLALIHGMFWNDERARNLGVREYDETGVSTSAQDVPESLDRVRAQGRYPVSDELWSAVPQLVERYPQQMRRISGTPQTLIHSDLHVENFFLEAGPDITRAILIDWQNACFGNVAIDIAGVLTSLRPDISRDARLELIAHYRRQLGGHSLDESDLVADVFAAITHQFVSSANWFGSPEADAFRDRKAMTGHWTRLVASLLAAQMAGGATGF